jgi:hypothetical protein
LKGRRKGGKIEIEELERKRKGKTEIDEQKERNEESEFCSWSSVVN